jgi:hypothetical protein
MDAEMGKTIDLGKLRAKQGSVVRGVAAVTAQPLAAPDMRLGAKDGASSNQMNIRVTDAFRKLLADGARDQGISMAQLVETAVKDYLARQSKQ